MAEASLSTQKVWVKLATLLQAVSQWLALDTGDMSAFDATTNALASETAVSGLARASATLSLQTTTVANDTCRAYKSFTAGAGATITGAGIFSASSSGDMWAWHRWAASIAVVSGDIINETIDIQMKAG